MVPSLVRLFNTDDLVSPCRKDPAGTAAALTSGYAEPPESRHRKGWHVIGLVLAAGAGRRLRPYTDQLPKALLPVDGETAILDICVRNLAAVGITDVTVVVGYRAEAVRERQAALEAAYGVRLDLVDNDRAEEWNNAYSLWLARERFADGALLVNGDTVHPVSVEKTLLGGRGPGVLLAVDAVKRLADEEMKVTVRPDGQVTRITKQMDPATAFGEYIGASMIEPAAAGPLADALAATWQRDPGLYYEDGFQELADRGGEVRVATIGDVEWVEVDNLADLARAREIACRC
jgi:choline kinase